MQMSNEEIYWILKSMAANLGFSDFGCAKSNIVSYLTQQQYLKAQSNGFFAGMDYLGRNIEKRFNPQLLVEKSKSVLVFLAPYALPYGQMPPEGIAQFALGEDYHTVIKEKLFLIMKKLQDLYPSFSGRAFTDSAPVLERYWAVEAGLGWIGKNNFLISKRHGIKNLIGTIICNIDLPCTDEIEPHKKDLNQGSCGGCTRCLDNCPTGALCEAYCTDSRKCISYHTIENKYLAEDMQNGNVPKFSQVIFGCDKCLDACPWNNANNDGWERFHKNTIMLSGRKQEWWESLSAEEFKKIFKGTSLLRGGLENIKASLEWGKKGDRNG